MSAQSLRARLFRVLARYDADGVEERVEIIDTSAHSLSRTSRTYMINLSNSEAKLAVLAELAMILTVTPDSGRSAVLQAWAVIRRDRENARSEAINAEASRVLQVNMQREAAWAAKVVGRGAAKFTSVRIIGGALASTLVVGLMLALLAVERNTRELRRVLSELQGPGGPPPDSGHA